MLSWLLLLSFVQVNEYVADEFIPILDTFDNEYFEKLILCIAVSCQWVPSNSVKAHLVMITLCFSPQMKIGNLQLLVKK